MIVKRSSAEVRGAAQKYVSEKYLEGKTVPESVIGFITSNAIVGKTREEIDDLVVHASAINGTLRGDGDKFHDWCLANGRDTPGEELIKLMNRDPFEAGEHVKSNVQELPMIWRSWCSYRSGKGRRRV